MEKMKEKEKQSQYKVKVEKNDEDNVLLTKAEIKKRKAKREAEKLEKLKALEHYRTLPPHKRRQQYGLPLDLYIAQSWSDAFLKNKTLLHLDISHNSFDSMEVETFRVGLD
jgi:hypothetical protein